MSIQSELRNADAARLGMYVWLASATADPASPSGCRIFDPFLQQVAGRASALLRDAPEAVPEVLSPGELHPQNLNIEDALHILDTHRQSLAAEYQRIFGLVSSKDCPPYETEYCPQTFSVYRSQQLADIAGFYLAFGIEPSRTCPERHDHISLELEFMAWLIAKEEHARSASSRDGIEKSATCRDAQRRFFAEHLSWWVPAFARALRLKAEGNANDAPGDVAARTFHGCLARNLAAMIAVERALLRVPPPDELVAPRPTEEGALDCGACVPCPVE
jgi:TorA maturation chaperone TorD